MTTIDLVIGIAQYRTHIDYGLSTTHAMKTKSTEDTRRTGTAIQSTNLTHTRKNMRRYLTLILRN